MRLEIHRRCAGTRHTPVRQRRRSRRPSRSGGPRKPGVPDRPARAGFLGQPPRGRHRRRSTSSRRRRIIASLQRVSCGGHWLSQRNQSPRNDQPELARPSRGITDSRSASWWLWRQAARPTHGTWTEAAMLQSSEATVRTHLLPIYGKLAVSSHASRGEGLRDWGVDHVKLPDG